MKIKHLISLSLLLAALSGPAAAAEKALTIIHTNDLHSHFLGHSPNKDYTPLTTGDDSTIGGWARIATVIKNVKSGRDNPVLVLDSGDFLMGTLFHMVSREDSLELRLMKEMGFDAVTLGNHEFDLKPAGLANILSMARRNGRMPVVVAANIVFDKKDPRDDSLETVFKKEIVKPYIVIGDPNGGLTIGIFGLLGLDAAEKAPFKKPVTIEDPIEVARRTVDILKNERKVDVVVCLSHSGVYDDREKSEDEILAEKIPGIDVIVSGHTHTRVPEPIVNGATGAIVVQNAGYGENIGVLDITVGGGKPTIIKYEQVEINDSISGDPHINKLIESYKNIVSRKVLAELNLEFNGVVAETAFDLRIEPKESNIGNLITDAYKWYMDGLETDPNDRVDVTIQSNGVIRSHILKGKTGLITVSDLFRTTPLGIGMDDTMAYPLVSFYLYGSEIKKALEVPTTVAPMKDPDYLLQFSGLKVTYNPYRAPFDRVTEILIDDGSGNFVQLDYSDSNEQLYKVASNIYNSTFIQIIGSFTNGILEMSPKDKNGNAIEKLSTVRIDADPDTPGIQELKEWKILMDYFRSFDDTDGDGIPDVPARYENLDGRMVSAPSLNPFNLMKRGNYITWIAFGAIILAIIILILILYVGVKIVKRFAS